MAATAGLLAAMAVFMATFARAASGTIQDVQHVVILMQENRSFDTYYGTLQGVRGFNDANILLFQNGASALFQPVPPYGATNFVLPIQVASQRIVDVPHDEGGGWAVWNNGWWNRWIQNRGVEAMPYYTRTNLSFYYALADAYTICDANFCAFNGPTFPNRLYLFTGTIDPGGTGGGPVLWNRVPAQGYSWTTYPERLQAAGVSWKVYRDAGDGYGDPLAWFSQYMNAAPGNPLYDRGVARVGNAVSALAADVTNGTLPQVSWIAPHFAYLEHPSDPPELGEYLVKQIMAVLAANPDVYNSTVFIITYDENGGFFDHVPPPVPPPGTANEFVNGSPLGLGPRVPMFIVSPWTRGGRVCSQVFDHTSVLRFLETWTGVQEPNISVWRRQTCGDLTSAFDFAHPDPSIPVLPLTLTGETNILTPVVPTPQTLPVQEAGTRVACPLPYQPDAFCYTDCYRNRLYISMINAGAAAVHFAIYPNTNRTDGPWQYDAPPGGFLVSDSFDISPGSGGIYDFTCYGPNGFQRRFAGNLNLDCNQLEITSQIDPVGGGITVGVFNSGPAPAHFTVTNNLSPSLSWSFDLAPASSTNKTFYAVADNNGWYDLTVTTGNDLHFIRHLAGHIETSGFSRTAVPAIVGNALSFSNAIPTNPAVIASINDLINYLIARDSLATAGTNSLKLTIGSYGGSCALIYPGWATNYDLHSTLNLSQPAWNLQNGAVTVVSNCNVVILPQTNASRLFRLEHQ